MITFKTISMFLTVLTYLLIFLLPLGQLGRITLYPGVNVYIHDVVVVAIIVTGGIAFFSQPRPKTPLLLPLLSFCVAALLSLIVASFHRPLSEVITGSLYLWRYLAYGLVYFVLRQFLPRKFTSILPEALIATGFITAVLGLLQYLLLPDTRFLYARFWDDHYYRLIGSLLDPNFTGIMLVLTLLLALDVYWDSFFARQKLSIRYLLLAICFIALMLTYSRSSYLAFLIGVTWLGLRKHSLKLILRCYVATLLFVLILPRPGGEGVKLERTQSAIARLSSSQQVVSIITDHPVFGVGFNLLKFEQRDRGIVGPDWLRSHSSSGADNSFLFVLATTGIVGLVSFLWLLKRQLLLSIKFKHFAFSSSLVAVIVHGQFNNSLFYPWVMLWLWLLLGSHSTKGYKSPSPS